LNKQIPVEKHMSLMGSKKFAKVWVCAPEDEAWDGLKPQRRRQTVPERDPERKPSAKKARRR